MKIKPFALERYFAKYEFSAPYLLSSSDCEPLTLKEVLGMADNETKELWQKLWLGYTESQGLPLLRSEVSSQYDNISPEEVVILTPEEGVFIAMNVLLQKGDHVIVTNPGYQSLYEIANSIDCEVTNWEPNPADWQFDVNFLRQNIKSNTVLIVINFPHNPTGSLLTRDQLNEIVDIANEHGITIFSDEMYRLLEYEDSNRLPSASDIYDNALSLSGVSKSLALAGLRIGWLTTKKTDLMQKIRNFKDYTTICSSAPSEVLALIALRAKTSILSRNLDIIQTNISAFDEFITRHPSQFKWVSPAAGSIAFPELLQGEIDSFCTEAVSKAGVMILPSSVYDYSGNNFRVGLGRKNFTEAPNNLEEFLSYKN